VDIGIFMLEVQSMTELSTSAYRLYLDHSMSFEPTPPELPIYTFSESRRRL